MITEVKVDTALLRSHTDIVRMEQRYVYELLDRLRYAQSLADPDINYHLHSVIQKADRLSYHCSAMISGLEEASDIFDRLIENIETILGDQIEASRPD